MKRIHGIGLFICLWAALMLAASARAAASEHIAGVMLVTLFWATVQGAGLWFAYRHDAPPDKKITDGIAVIGLCMFLLELFTGSLLQALMSLLLWLQAARNPLLATRRDAYFALLISLTLIIFGASESRSSWFLLVMVTYGLSALGVLVYCHQQSGFDNEMQAGAAGGVVRLRSVSMRHLGALTACVFMIALLWYLLVPRPAAMNIGGVPTHGGQKYSRSDWEREARNSAGHKTRDGEQGSGEARQNQRDDSKPNAEHEPPQPDDELDITRPGTREDSKNPVPSVGNGVVMYVQADRSLYLRERSYDRFENNRWSAADSRTRKLLPERGKFTLPSPTDGEKVQYLVQVVSALRDNLPLSAHAESVQAAAGVIAQGRDGAVFLPDRIDAGFRYGATALLPTNAERPIARDALGEPAHYLQLPPGYSQRIGDLARQVTANAASPYEKALALEAHLRSSYAYSFETIFTSQNVTPLEEFLFETRRGHCEFFASAMAVMLREIGIPSRVVNGYLAQGFNPVTGLYEVRAFDRHAWVEAHLDGIGWMSFEPTAAYPLPKLQKQTGVTLDDLKNYAEKLAQQAAARGEKGAVLSLSDLLRALADAWHQLLFLVQAWFDALQAWIAAHPWLIATLFGGVALTGFAAYRQRALLWWLWARIVMRGAPAAEVPLTAFRQLERVARARKLGRIASETAEEYLARLEAAYAELHKELRILRRAFVAARYGGKRLSVDDTHTVVRAFHAIGSVLSAR